MTDDKLKIEFEQLKKDVFSDDWELVKSSADRLGQIGGGEVVDFLITLIASDNSSIRNRAALALEDIKDNRALEPLLTAIFKKENHNYNGTMVFALESLDCSQKLKEIFRILFYETYESKISAYAILSDQIFDFTKEDLLEIKNMWEDCKQHPDKCPGYDDLETREMMQDAVDGFMSYLKLKKQPKTTDNGKTKKKPRS
jgi:HEAT repeat protein